MSVAVRTLHPLSVGEVSGVDLRTSLAAADISVRHAALDRHARPVFRDQAMTPGQQRAMTRQFGVLELGFARVAGRHRDFAAQPPRTGDLVIWDNRATLHRGRRWDMNEVRELRRTIVADVGPT